MSIDGHIKPTISFAIIVWEGRMAIEHRLSPDAPKRATNISVNEELLALAKELAINVSRASEQGIAQAVARKQAERWLEENREAIESSNAYVEKNGLPLARYRQF